MKSSKKMQIRSKNAENGASLAILLVLVALFLGAVSLYYKSSNNQALESEVKIAAWEGVQIARAARIYVRNLIADVQDVDMALSGAANPQEHVAIASAGSPEITIDDLINENLLPPNFLGTGTSRARVNADGNFINALGQEIVIIQQNFPLGGDTNDPATVPTAYVLFNENPNINDRVESDLMLTLSQSMILMDITLYPALFDGLTNISIDCRGEPSITFWDINCLNNSDYRALTGENFEQGSFVIPAWRSVTFDTRAIMRFPQPEQLGSNMMLTDLSMASDVDCSTSVTINDPTGARSAPNGSSDMGEFNTTRPICETADDDIANLEDNRRSILRPRSIEADNLVLDPQTDFDVYSYGTGLLTKTDEDNDVAYDGNLIVNNGGDVRIFDNTAPGTGLVVNANASVSSAVILRTNIPATTSEFTHVTSDFVNAQNLTFNNTEVETNAALEVGTLASVDRLQATQPMVPGTINVRSDNFQLNIGELKVQSFSNAMDNLSIDASEASENDLIEGTRNLFAGKITVETELTSNDILTTRDLTAQDNFEIEYRRNEAGQIVDNMTGRINVSNDSGTAECIGVNACPLRSGERICRNLRDLGLLTVEGFSSFEDCIREYDPT